MKIITADDLTALAAEAAARPRRRLNRNLHPELSDPVQRLLNALEPGTYVRPHRHVDGVWEMFALLSGALAVPIFDAEGRLLSRIEMAETGARIVELPSGAWHSLVSRAPGTVVVEVKPGPYRPLDDKDFAAWAPVEGAPEAAELEGWMATAAIGGTWR